jgi:hypothetical protein
MRKSLFSVMPSMYNYVYICIDITVSWRSFSASAVTGTRERHLSLCIWQCPQLLFCIYTSLYQLFYRKKSKNSHDGAWPTFWVYHTSNDNKRLACRFNCSCDANQKSLNSSNFHVSRKILDSYIALAPHSKAFISLSYYSCWYALVLFRNQFCISFS